MATAWWHIAQRRILLYISIPHSLIQNSTWHSLLYWVKIQSGKTENRAGPQCVYVLLIYWLNFRSHFETKLILNYGCRLPTVGSSSLLESRVWVLNSVERECLCRSEIWTPPFLTWLVWPVPVGWAVLAVGGGRLTTLFVPMEILVRSGLCCTCLQVHRERAWQTEIMCSKFFYARLSGYTEFDFAGRYKYKFVQSIFFTYKLVVPYPCFF